MMRRGFSSPLAWTYDLRRSSPAVAFTPAAAVRSTAGAVQETPIRSLRRRDNRRDDGSGFFIAPVEECGHRNARHYLADFDCGSGLLRRRLSKRSDRWHWRRIVGRSGSCCLLTGENLEVADEVRFKSDGLARRY